LYERSIQVLLEKHLHFRGKKLVFAGDKNLGRLVIGLLYPYPSCEQKEDADNKKKSNKTKES
jgi:hypothetical protein